MKWNDSLAGDFLWTNSNFCEAICDVMTPATWSMWQIYMKAMPFKVPGYPLVGAIGGRPYINLSLLASFGRALGMDAGGMLRRSEDLWGRIPEGVEKTNMRTSRGIGSFLLTLAIYLGLPLIGWGHDDWPGFLSLPQRLGYAMTIIAFGMVAGYEMIRRPEALHGGRGQEGKLVPRQRIVRVLVTGMLLAALVLVPFADRHSIGVMANNSAARWLGLVLATLGMGLILWSGWALGRLYSPEVTIQKDHRLITDGPYRCIRHPHYLGGTMQGVGLSLLFRSWIGLALTGLFVAIVLFRISDEEALMRREFGPEWQAYCARSWRLLPGIW